MGSNNNRVVRTETTPGAEVQLAARAGQVLRQSDLGDRTRAAPNLYPHHWSWDSAFIAIGLAHLSTRCAAKELLALFETPFFRCVFPLRLLFRRMGLRCPNFRRLPGRRLPPPLGY